ncbi:MAG: 5-formyltetrahydrofolate cyclo-ligase [Caulobacteraceae bacterium]|nr:5-formyltetrahydrofolate cyclo-ligase [Caulobacteraceae bacterium]
MVHASVLSAKTALRLEARALRKGLAKANPEAARQIAAAAPLERLSRFAVVAGYRPLGGEIDPWPLMRRLVAAGAALALPVTLDLDLPLAFRAFAEGDPTAPDALGIPSPQENAAAQEPDLIITPLLAFDRSGGRMGQGAGCYDRTIEALRARRPIFALGLAYAGQEVARLPVEPHDQKLDAILTENGYIEIEKDL